MKPERVIFNAAAALAVILGWGLLPPGVRSAPLGVFIAALAVILVLGWIASTIFLEARANGWIASRWKQLGLGSALVASQFALSQMVKTSWLI
jgi:K+-transporting ATPase c subunit